MKTTLIKKFYPFFDNAQGTTLVEIMVTVALFTVLVGASLGLLMNGSDSYNINRNKMELQQELRKALDWTKDDLRQTGTSGLVNMNTDTTYTQVTFRTAVGAAAGGTTTWSANTIQYILGGTGGVQLQRISGGTTKIVSQNITLLQFRRNSTAPNLVIVTMTASRNEGKGGTISLNYTMQVKMRN